MDIYPLEIMGVEAMMNVSLATAHECALQNKLFPDIILKPATRLDKDSKELAHCLATPNPDQLLDEQNRRQVENENRFGELLMRVRRQRRSTKTID